VEVTPTSPEASRSWQLGKPARMGSGKGASSMRVHSGVFAAASSASNAYIMLCSVPTKTTFFLAPLMVNPPT
jgi:hypothetical protein